ncbi:hypothetical protein [Cyanobium sp. ULC082]
MAGSSSRRNRHSSSSPQHHVSDVQAASPSLSALTIRTTSLPWQGWGAPTRLRN